MTTNPEVMERMYWHSNPSWYSYDDTIGGIEGYQINPDAPERAQKSFKEWLKHRDE